MAHKLYQVVGFEIVGTYSILVTFDDGSEQTIDFEPLLHGRLWGALLDPAMFNQVALDPIAKTLTWPNGADFDPETLRNWPDYVEALVARVQKNAEHSSYAHSYS